MGVVRVSLHALVIGQSQPDESLSENDCTCAQRWRLKSASDRIVGVSRIMGRAVEQAGRALVPAHKRQEGLIDAQSSQPDVMSRATTIFIWLRDSAYFAPTHGM